MNWPDVEPLPTVASDDTLVGQTFVVTGTLESMTREEAQEALIALGAKVSKSVSKKDELRGRGIGAWLEAAEGRGARRRGVG